MLPRPYLKRKFEAVVRTWHSSGARKPLLVQGARRTGKTSVLEHVGRDLAGDGFVKLDFQTDLRTISKIFDGPTDDVDAIVRRISEYKRIRIEPETSLLLFDEVQLDERALNSLRFFADSPWKVLASGSLLGVSLGQRSLPFPSGVTQVELHPLDFEEFLWAMGEERMAEDIATHYESLEPYVSHDDALNLYRKYLVIGGMPLPVRRYVETESLPRVREELEEIDATYTADMTRPSSGISGVSAKRIWDSLPKQLLRSSTKKFKFTDVIRGGRRSRLLEPLEWLQAAGIVTINDLTRDMQAPLTPFNDEEGSFFKAYVADTGLMFHKFGIDPKLFLASLNGGAPLSSDFRGALSENYVMQALRANDVKTFYWMPRNGGPGEERSAARGEIDFVFQNDAGAVIPIEVKSARNVSAKSLSRFMREGSSPYAIRLSTKEFGTSEVSEGQQLRSVPLYAAFCIK